MTHNPAYRVNTPAVVFERFDDEVVAINLESGVYHSLNGSAADIFALLDQTASFIEIRDALAAKYAEAGPVIEAALAPFLEQLLEAKLAALVPPETVLVSRTAPVLAIPASTQSGARTPFTPPAIEAYQDLQNLLSVDPVHEVGEMGWPQPQPGTDQQV